MASLMESLIGFVSSFQSPINNRVVFTGRAAKRFAEAVRRSVLASCSPQTGNDLGASVFGSVLTARGRPDQGSMSKVRQWNGGAVPIGFTQEM